MDDNTATTLWAAMAAVTLCFMVSTCFKTLGAEHMANYGYQQTEGPTGKVLWVPIPKKIEPEIKNEEN